MSEEDTFVSKTVEMYCEDCGWHEPVEIDLNGGSGGGSGGMEIPVPSEAGDVDGDSDGNSDGNSGDEKGNEGNGGNGSENDEESEGNSSSDDTNEGEGGEDATSGNSAGANSAGRDLQEVEAPQAIIDEIWADESFQKAVKNRVKYDMRGFKPRGDLDIFGDVNKMNSLTISKEMIIQRDVLSKYFKHISKSLEATILKKQRTGRLDKRRAKQLLINNDMRIFQKKIGSQVKASKMAVGIVLDRSGSMGGGRIRVASEVCWSLANAVEDAGHHVAIHGIGIDNWEKTWNTKCKNASWTYDTGGGTPVYVGLDAMEDAFGQMRRVKKDINQILFVLTDGSWHSRGGYHGSNSNPNRGDYREQLERMRAHGIYVVYIGIQTSNQPQDGRGVLPLDKSIPTSSVTEAGKKLVSELASFQVEVAKKLLKNRHRLAR